MSKNGFLGSISPAVRHLLIVNVVIWIATIVFEWQGFDLVRYLGLHYVEAPDFNLAQFVTYMFMHDTRSIAHIFFNMFSLYMFGRILEQVMGTKRFLVYYLLTGIGAALVQEAAMWFDLRDVLASTAPFVSFPNGMIATVPEYLNMFVAVGASGAVFGILLAFGMLFPNAPLYLFFIPVPIKAKWMVIGYGALELVFGVSGTMGGVAHFAHLGGLLFGLLIILLWKKQGKLGGGYYS